MTTERPGSALDVVVNDGRCFACGPYNELGLRLTFELAGDGEVRCATTLAGTYQGWAGVAHGGIVMTLLDEAMAHAAGAAGQRGVTAEVTVRFRRPVPIGEPLVLTGRVLWRRRSVFGLAAEIVGEAGTLLASGEGKFVAKGAVEPGKLGVPDPV